MISNENVLVWTRPEDLVPTTNERFYSCPLPTCTFSTGTYGPLQRYMADLFCQPEDTKELVDVVLTSTCDKSGVKELSYIKKCKKEACTSTSKRRQVLGRKKQTANVTNSLHAPVLPVYRTMKTAMSRAHLLFIRWCDEEQVCSRHHLFRDPSYLCYKPSAPVPKDTLRIKKKVLVLDATGMRTGSFHRNC